MNSVNADIPGLLSASRMNLRDAIFRIRALEHRAPRIAAQERGRLLGLMTEQRRLETLSGANPDPNLGAFILPLVYAGMGLAALGTWVFKHYQDTSLEKKRLEMFDQCVQAKQAVGASIEEAQHACMSLRAGPGGGIIAQMSGLLKNAALAGIAIGVVWWVIKRK